LIFSNPCIILVLLMYLLLKFKREVVMKYLIVVAVLVGMILVGCSDDNNPGSGGKGNGGVVIKRDSRIVNADNEVWASRSGAWGYHFRSDGSWGATTYTPRGYVVEAQADGLWRTNGDSLVTYDTTLKHDPLQNGVDFKYWFSKNNDTLFLHEYPIQLYSVAILIRGAGLFPIEKWW
jgi:hypothetical protein